MQLFEKLPAGACHDHEQAVHPAPQNERPVRAVPQAADEIDDQDVQVRPHGPAAAAAVGSTRISGESASG